MKKIADGYYRTKEIARPAAGCSVFFTLDRIDGEDMDATVSLDGNFVIAGSQRHEFTTRLGALINKYRI